MLVIFALWFYILRPCWSCLSVSGDFGLRQWGLLNIQSCRLQIDTIWLPPFLSEYPLFLFLAWLLWLELPTLYWIGVVREHPSLLPRFKGNSSSFCPFSILVVGLSYIAFIILRYVLLIPSLLRVFSIKGCWILSKAFSASIEIIMWFLSLVLCGELRLQTCICWTSLASPGWSLLDHDA